ncbi:MAG: hypothetical protein ACPG7F_18720 [Aggregatilineales bacterium]
MAQKKRNILDDLIEAGRDLVDHLDKLFNPDRRVPARVPIPVRSRPPVHNPDRR